MGNIIRFTHRECGFKFDFFEGVGFSLFRLQCNAREKIRSGEYFTEPRIKFYVPDDGYLYEFSEKNEDMVPTHVIYEHYHLLEKEDMVCPDCYSSATVMENLNQVPCPVCRKMCKGRDVGNWD